MNQPDEITKSTRQKVRILHAEDDAVVAHAVELVLSRNGLHVEWVNNGTDALSRIKTHPNQYSVLITDQNMPGHTGVQLVQCLSEIDYQGEVIVLSSIRSRETEAQFYALGVRHQISKSVALTSLLSVVQKILSESEGVHS